MSLLPHMHLRGKSFEIRRRLPDGQEEMLLSVAALRLQLADELSARSAARPAGRQPHSLHGALRQFGRQPEQSRSHRAGPLGRANVGRDDGRDLRLRTAGRLYGLAKNRKAGTIAGHLGAVAAAGTYRGPR